MNEKHELQAIKTTPLSAGDMQKQVNIIQEMMKQVMIKDTHFGVIVGCQSPSLYKAGAEKLLATFRLAPEIIVDDLSDNEQARFRVTIRLISAIGQFVGSGIGEASSFEEKFKWRAAICDAEFDETPAGNRREKWKKGYFDKQKRIAVDPSKVKQIRTEKADLANTILKMAKKRALVDATLTATAASDIFTQDVEDLPEGYIDAEFSSAPEPEKKEPVLKMYGDELFIKNFAGFESAIKSGKKTVLEMIAMIETKGKLTDKQKEELQKVVLNSDPF